MADYPPKLQEYLEDFSFISTREERVDYLIAIADEFVAGAARDCDQAIR